MSKAVAWCWLYRLVACWLVASPWSLAVADHVGQVPAGDAVLWDHGGLWLTETARWLEPSWREPSRQAGLLGLLVGVGWWGVIGGLVGESAGAARPWGAAWERMGSLVLLAGLGLLVQVVVLVGGGVAVLWWKQGWWLVGLVVGGWWLIVSAFVDVARVARFEGDTWSALRRAWGALSTRPGLWWSGAWRWGLSVAFLAAGLAGAQGVAASGGRVAGALALPALGLLAWMVLRASWLRAAGRVVRDQASR